MRCTCSTTAPSPAHFRVTLQHLKKAALDVDLVDAGEGLMDVLPVLVALELGRMRLPEAPRLLAVEEPESHLHPKLQRALAEHIASTLATGEVPCIILKTHSQHILLQIQGVWLFWDDSRREGPFSLWGDRGEGGPADTALGRKMGPRGAQEAGRMPLPRPFPGGEAPCSASAPAPNPCNHTRNPSSWKSHTPIQVQLARGILRPEQVQVYWVHQDEVGRSRAYPVPLDEEGRLSAPWPADVYSEAQDMAADLVLARQERRRP